MPMRIGFVAVLTALLPCAGVTFAQDLAVVIPNVDSCDCCCDCEQAPPSSQLWVSGEYLLWWVKNGPLSVPLITTGPFLPPPGVSPGVLGQPGTTLVYGLTDINYHT